jgi:hypothetical protein
MSETTVTYDYQAGEQLLLDVILDQRTTITELQRQIAEAQHFIDGLNLALKVHYAKMESTTTAEMPA